MTDGRVKQVFRPKLLAFVLALALTWYTLNPAPGPVRPRARRGNDEPDAERRERKPAPARAPSPGFNAPTRDDDADEELDWPEYIY
ncbi:MAG TPA: hypothetical protein VER08_00235 [Pyrinomonadaceae bacterium]|nr:hypothetical protein [Pyrinomonadaceae bacterium]